MTPKQLRDKWGLTNTQLAIAIGKKEQTVKQYMAREGTNSYRKTPMTIRILCTQLDREWSRSGLPEIFFCAA